jgi:hypothetical protein
LGVDDQVPRESLIQSFVTQGKAHPPPSHARRLAFLQNLNGCRHLNAYNINTSKRC